MSPLENIEGNSWSESFTEGTVSRATAALESGRVLFFPRLPFVLQPDETTFLDPRCCDRRAKGVSYDAVTQGLRGTSLVGHERERLQRLVVRFAESAQSLVVRVLPSYASSLRRGRTSYHPVETKERPSSFRRDDSRLHVDAFPSRPNGGERILRVFSNVNPNGQASLWRIGEPFEACAERFLKSLPQPFPGKSWILQALGLTQGYRSPYDHYMLALHDAMKADSRYQQQCPQYEVPFPAGTTWIAFTDQVSYAAMTGQYLFEQTFHVSVRGLQSPETAPLHVLERLFARSLGATQTSL